jgi:hypothetical protein
MCGETSFGTTQKYLNHIKTCKKKTLDKSEWKNPTRIESKLHKKVRKAIKESRKQLRSGYEQVELEANSGGNSAKRKADSLERLSQRQRIQDTATSPALMSNATFAQAESIRSAPVPTYLPSIELHNTPGSYASSSWQTFHGLEAYVDNNFPSNDYDTLINPERAIVFNKRSINSGGEIAENVLYNSYDSFSLQS